MSIGAPDINADSNYWGSSSTQYFDSVIYDYFDSGNSTIVFYQPVLTSPLTIDSSCVPRILIGISEIMNDKKRMHSWAYPNPFSKSTRIIISEEIKDGVLLLYNVLGRKERTIENIRGKEIYLERAGLNDGIYFYQLIEKGKQISIGKLVVN